MQEHCACAPASIRKVHLFSNQGMRRSVYMTIRLHAAEKDYNSSFAGRCLDSASDILSARASSGSFSNSLRSIPRILVTLLKKSSLRPTTTVLHASSFSVLLEITFLTNSACSPNSTRASLIGKHTTLLIHSTSSQRTLSNSCGPRSAPKKTSILLSDSCLFISAILLLWNTLPSIRLSSSRTLETKESRCGLLHVGVRM
eukprot:jgi/Antlo1/2238/361